jgi:hypothetical protein
MMIAIVGIFGQRSDGDEDEIIGAEIDAAFDAVFDPGNPLKKVGSQSQSNALMDPFNLATKPKSGLDIIKESKPPTPQEMADEN